MNPEKLKKMKFVYLFMLFRKKKKLELKSGTFEI